MPIPPIGTAGIEPASEPESNYEVRKTALSCHWTMFRKYVGREASFRKVILPALHILPRFMVPVTLCTNPELWVATAAKPDDQLRDLNPEPMALPIELSWSRAQVCHLGAWVFLLDLDHVKDARLSGLSLAFAASERRDSNPHQK